MNQRAEVEIQYMKRIGTDQYYFEVWVRSVLHPERKFGTIVERSSDERKNIGIAAGALAEHSAEKFDERRDPSSACRAAISAYDRLNDLNPIPTWGDEKPIDC